MKTIKEYLNLEGLPTALISQTDEAYHVDNFVTNVLVSFEDVREAYQYAQAVTNQVNRNVLGGAL